MSITAIGFLSIYLAGLALSLFRHPRFGLYTYLFAFYMHPPDRWWRVDVPDWRWAFVAGLVTLLSTVRLDADKLRTPWYQTGGGVLLLLYWLWMLIQGLWVVSPYHAEGVELYGKYVLLFYLIYRLVDSEEELRNFFLLHMLGSFYLGWLAYGKNFHGRLEGVGAPGIDDANTFAMHMSTAAFFSGALLLRGGRYLRLAVVGAAPFILNAMILTQSRGAFVGLLAGGLGVLFAKPASRTGTVYALGILAVVLVVILSPPNFVERMGTIGAVADETAEVDNSAATRIEVAEAQFQMFKDYPFGAGHHGTRALSSFYLDEDRLTSNKGGGMARSSHNTLLAVLVDQGIVGIALYAGILGWVAFTLLRLNRLDKSGLPPNLAGYRMSLAGAFALIVAAGMFSNYIKAEITIWCLALLASLQAQCLAAVEAPVNHATGSPSKAAPAIQQKAT